VVRASRAAVFAALLDPAAIEAWRVPDDMTARVEQLDARVGGRFRLTLTYVDDRPGKSGDRADS
jgi:uncharacterized protein YndB with AHSA1/START domain